MSLCRGVYCEIHALAHFWVIFGIPTVLLQPYYHSEMISLRVWKKEYSLTRVDEQDEEYLQREHKISISKWNILLYLFLLSLLFLAGLMIGMSQLSKTSMAVKCESSGRQSLQTVELHTHIVIQ